MFTMYIIYYSWEKKIMNKVDAFLEQVNIQTKI